MTAYRLVPNYDKPLRMLLIELDDKPRAVTAASVVELMNRNKAVVWWEAVPVVREVKEKRA